MWRRRRRMRIRWSRCWRRRCSRWGGEGDGVDGGGRGGKGDRVHEGGKGCGGDGVRGGEGDE
jgi:hypothetical protein